MKGTHVLLPSLVLLLIGVLVSAQPRRRRSESTRIRTLLKSFGTKDRTALGVISSTHFMQHDPRVADGREGFTAFVNDVPRGTTVRIVRIFADGDYVVAQTEYSLSTRKVMFDVFRFENRQIVEHWDNAQDECPAPNISGRTQLDGPTQVVDLDKTDANKAAMNGYFRDVVFGGQGNKVAQYKSIDQFHQHNCEGADNPASLQAKSVFKINTLHKVLGQGNFVLMISEGLFNGQPTAFYDLYRLEAAKQVEHWDVLEPIPPASEWKNANGKF